MKYLFNSKFVAKVYKMEFSSVFLFTLLPCFYFVNSQVAQLKFYEERDYHIPKDLSKEEILRISNLTDMVHFKAILNEILIPRVVGTPNHLKVGNFIVDQMKYLGWDIKEDVFPDNTPVFGVLNFRNIIATLNPNADRYLVLACHYDSKYIREFEFVGATDSAVPCAMMINLAKTLSEQLKPFNKTRLSLMFIFFDGEEAFLEWGPNDAIYGAKHLASEWECTKYKDGANHLQRIDLLILLDLLGAPDPTFYSYFSATEKWYIRLAKAERSLAELGQFSAYTRGRDEQNYFILSSSGVYIEDDHVPFLKRKVPVIHMIEFPFPHFWHEIGDNLSALDFTTIENLNKILRVVVVEYLNGIVVVKPKVSKQQPSLPQVSKKPDVNSKTKKSNAMPSSLTITYWSVIIPGVVSVWCQP